MEVTATHRGYYGSKIREPGERFGLTDEKHFSPHWMRADEKPAAPKAPEPKAPEPKAPDPKAPHKK